MHIRSTCNLMLAAGVIGALALPMRARAAEPAAAMGNPLTAMSGGAMGNIDLEADSINIKQEAGGYNTMEAHGDVRLLSESLNMYCEHLTYDPDDRKMHATAGIGQRVKINSDTNKIDAECGRLVYDMATDRYILTDGARIFQQGADLEGETITIRIPKSGGIQLLANSSAEERQSQAEKDRVRNRRLGSTASNDKAPDSIDKISNMEKTFGVSVEEANRLVHGQNRAATIMIDPSTLGAKNAQAAKEKAAKSAGAKGKIHAGNVSAIPDKSGTPIEPAAGGFGLTPPKK